MSNMNIVKSLDFFSPLGKLESFDSAAYKSLRAVGTSASLIGVGGMVGATHELYPYLFTGGLAAAFASLGLMTAHRNFKIWKVQKDVEALNRDMVQADNYEEARDVFRGLIGLAHDIEQCWPHSEVEGKAVRAVWVHTALNIVEKVQYMDTATWFSVDTETMQLQKIANHYTKMDKHTKVERVPETQLSMDY
jgi:hypothetical protein